MAPSEPPADITLRVKVPPGHVEGGNDEFTLGTLPSRSTVGEIRQRIQQILPSHPSPARQRLLYAGRALIDNEQTLADALNTRRDVSQSEYVMHLLVKGDQGTTPLPAAAAGSGHVSSPSTPNVARAGTPQGQVNAAGATPGPLPGVLPGIPQGVPPGVLPQLPPMSQLGPQHLPLIQQRQAILQQQAMQQRAGALPFGMPPVQLGGHMHGQLPPQFQQPMRHAPGQQPVPGAGPQTDAGESPGANPSGPSSEQSGAQAIPDQAQQPQGIAGRPVSGQGFHVQGMGPNGNRFEIHQQTLNFPAAAFQGQQLPFPMGFAQIPGMGLPFPLPGMAQQQQQQQQQPNGAPGLGPHANAPSALDRARQNVAEMRRMIDEMRGENSTEEGRARIARLQENIDAVNGYIDPFGVGRTNAASRTTSPLPPRAPTQSIQPPNPLFSGMAQQRFHPNAMPPHPRPITVQQPSNPSDVTCYLLSSPNGPQALLLSPQHGSYNGTLANNANASLTPGLPTGFRAATPATAQVLGQPAPTPTQTAGAPQAQDQPANAHGANQVAAVLQQQAPAAAADPAGPLQALLNHFWLLFRVLIFAYFLLGANMGWRRPIALLLISLGFWMIRTGLFGEGGVARRWWEGVMRVEQAGGPGDNQVHAGDQLDPRQMPTPEQLAARILRQREEQARRAPMGRLREFVRPVERAAALFFASLWPGVGEAHVRAREAEERRAAEAEVERRRQEEETRREAEEKEKERIEGGSGEGEKAPALGSGQEGAQAGVSESGQADGDTAVARGEGEKSGSIAAL